jgi:epoxyqueuosine reductase
VADFIGAAARRLGFDACGVVPAEVSPDRDRFMDWLAQGCHGEMAWLARDPERRVDPRRVVPGCRSVIVVAMNHFPGPLPPKPDDAPRGRIASYALGLDYHDLMIERLRALCAELGDPAARCYVDTGPVLERSVAEAAGLGWVGKNANFIVPGLGSYAFLGAILTTLELEASPPGRISCGTCGACLPACPTGAIVAPGRIDSRICISYLTIELRGPIPRELRSKLGDWVYGCDDCQDPCPWNRKAPAAAEPRFAALADRVWPRLDDLVTLTQEQFSRRFKGSAIKRAKRTGLARNAAVALGNSGDTRGIRALRLALSGDPSPLVRGHAAWALGQLGDDGSLRAAMRLEPDQEAQAEIVAALGGRR